MKTGFNAIDNLSKPTKITAFLAKIKPSKKCLQQIKRDLKGVSKTPPDIVL